MARGFENGCEIIADKASENLEKRLAGAIYKEEKWRNGDKKNFTTTTKKKNLWHIYQSVTAVAAGFLPPQAVPWGLPEARSTMP